MLGSQLKLIIRSDAMPCQHRGHKVSKFCCTVVILYVAPAPRRRAFRWLSASTTSQLALACEIIHTRQQVTKLAVRVSKRTVLGHGRTFCSHTGLYCRLSSFRASSFNLSSGDVADTHPGSIMTYLAAPLRQIVNDITAYSCVSGARRINMQIEINKNNYVTASLRMRVQ